MRPSILGMWIHDARRCKAPGQAAALSRRSTGPECREFLRPSIDGLARGSADRNVCRDKHILTGLSAASPEYEPKKPPLFDLKDHHQIIGNRPD